MTAGLVISITGAILKWGLQWFGTQMVHELLDRLAMFYYDMQERHAKTELQRMINDLDLQARAHAVREREFLKRGK